MGRQRRRRRKFGVADAVLLGIAAAALAAAAFIFGGQAMSDASYSELSAAANGGETASGSPIDWDGLRSQNPDIAAWLVVDGTPIDYPVVSQRDEDPDGFYLSHDFWRNRSSSGCPYLERGVSADGPHALVFGHHLGLTGKMFSSIYKAYSQSSFNEVGKAHWSTPDRGSTTFHPLCAMSVDKTYQAIQTYDFGSQGELREWLSEIVADSSAASPNSSELVSRATRALTLVTCSSAWSGQRARTLLVFVAVEPQESGSSS